MKNNNWSRDELIVAFNLYLKTPFGKIGARNKSIIELASIIGRTPSVVDLKLFQVVPFSNAVSFKPGSLLLCRKQGVRLD